MSLSNEFRERCEGIAATERRALGLQGHEPLSGSTLAARHNITIVTPDQLLVDTDLRETFLMQTSIMAALSQQDGYYPLILIHPHQAPTRRESTLMHEIAHYLLEHEVCDLDALLRGEKRNKAQEEEANHLGSCLQIPRTALRWAKQAGLSSGRVASHFGASAAMVEFRCRMTGIRFTKRRLVSLGAY
jgi:Zn-dependent peptidase ImmA (M78 family)